VVKSSAAAGQLQAFRGEILHFLDDPAVAGDQAWQYWADGLLLVEDGHIAAAGDAAELLPNLSEDVPLTHYRDALIVPGFVDTHVHFPQVEMIASGGEQLLDWLQQYAFPAEEKFADVRHAERMAEFFLTQLLRSGTTTAMVFGSVHPQSVEAFFTEAERRNLRMICGKVLMDRHVPESLRDTAESGCQQSRALIERWHGRGRLQYAVTPRFAASCSDAQLQSAGRLLREFPDVYMQTHLSESEHEVVWVQELFPDSDHYLHVYEQYGLLGKRSVFAHGIHLCDSECQRLADTQSSVAFCPSSNLFLGSGLFDLPQAQRFGFEVGLGTDVGAGTSLSLLQTMSDAYKVQQLRGDQLVAEKSFYMATLGGARALDLDAQIGNFQVGKEADFIVLDYNATPLLQLRMQQCRDIRERLFVFSILGDDRAVAATHILGQLFTD